MAWPSRRRLAFAVIPAVAAAVLLWDIGGWVLLAIGVVVGAAIAWAWRRSGRRRRDGSRLRRTRAVGRWLVLVWGVVTLASAAFNLLTTPRDHVTAPYGSYAEVDGTSVHYERWGTTGSPIVLVHGFLESTLVWHRMAQLLAAKHVVYALDLAGYGYSDANGRYGINDQAALIDGFVRHFHLQKPMLLGHSQGAAFVGAVALAHPGDVGKVVFVDGDGRSIPTPPSWIRKAFVRAPYLTSVYRIATNWTGLAKSMIRRACGPGCGPTDAEADAWLKPLRQHRTEQAFFKMAEHGVPALTASQISAIAVPRAIIWGQQDHQGGSLSATITALHHPPVHVIPDAGHLSMMADPTAFARAVLGEAPATRTAAATSSVRP
ncbi:MAG: alpha/beta hydrolase [Thermoleophilia bacterium]